MLERIWAPWRAQYIQDASQETGVGAMPCFLCRGLAEYDDRANLLVWRGHHSVVVLNRFPLQQRPSPGCPRVHRGSLEELAGPDLAGADRDGPLDDRILDRMLRPQGYNVGLNQGKAAGAGLPGHLHWHIVPRWDGDTNFMPVLGETKVIVESLFDFYDRLSRRSELAERSQRVLITSAMAS